jgi:hypothetical protein
MITTALLYALYGLIYVITLPIRNLADVVMATDFSTAITTANGYIASLNTFIPVDTIIQILVVFVGIETAVLTYKLIMWVIRRIPAQG